MEIIELNEYGIDTEKGLERCLNDEVFYLKLLGMFLKDTSFIRAKAALKSGNHTELFNCVHELKGACGNADLKELYKEVCPLVELLRYDTGTDSEIAAQFERMEKAYEHVTEGIKKITETDG